MEIPQQEALITGKNYIGAELSALGKITYKTIDPERNIENETIFFEVTKEELNKALEKAASAFEVYSRKSGSEKADFLEACATEIENLGEFLIQTYTRESALPEGRAKAELARTLGQLRSFAQMLREGNWLEAIISKAEGKPDLRRMLFPLGPVAVFGASNFPLAFSTAGGDTASALACGCPVVVKSHPLHAGTGELVASAIIKAAEKTGMPDGIFSNLNSKGIEVGQWLVNHPKIKAVGFTGSQKAGMALYRLAASRPEPIPVYAEMGSINPVVILPSALEDKSEHWAVQYANSITAGTGQFCTNPGLLLTVENAHLNNFLQMLGDKISKVQPGCMLHPSIKEQYESGKAEILSQKDFSEIGSYKDDVETNYAGQNLISVPAKAFLGNRKFHKEVFGPFSVVVRCENSEELSEVLKNLEGQLTGTVLSSSENELKEYEQAIEHLRSKVGRLIFNNVPTGVEVSPAMTHGGPFPATSDPKFTSVGLTAVKRWVRPVTFQDWPDILLPEELKNENPLNILRTYNGEVTPAQIVNG